MIDVKSKKDNITVDYLLEICLLNRAVYYSDYVKMKGRIVREAEHQVN